MEGEEEERDEVRWSREKKAERELVWVGRLHGGGAQTRVGGSGASRRVGSRLGRVFDHLFGVHRAHRGHCIEDLSNCPLQNRSGRRRLRT